ncbi:MAG: exo-beta-N-acetylmuramidase NamZ family protein, partial [Thermodesulforhabdaceae bacterium]
LCNQASVTSKLRPVPEELMQIGAQIVCLFSPQHGFFSEKQANMIESDHTIHPKLRVPIFSLYGEHRSPTPEMLNFIDVLLVDIQDVGTRVYTYATTMGLFLEALSGLDKKVVVLDRPNPIGGSKVEGNIVEREFRSFVGRYSLPMRHGLTMGELARWIVMEKGLDVDLTVITMDLWSRNSEFPETGLPWVFPSPNMPSWETALLYPSTVLLEGTNVSEGRGTTLPFAVVGAPFINPYDCIESWGVKRLEEYGVFLRPVVFEPVYDKWSGKACGGFQIHIIDKVRWKPYKFGLELLQKLMTLYPNDFRWLDPPYEYEWEKRPIDILIGSSRIRKALEAGVKIDELEFKWQVEVEEYLQRREDVLLYSD